MYDLKDLGLIQDKLLDVTDNLKGFESMLGVFYHGMILNPDADLWQDKPEERVRLLTDPYNMILDYIRHSIQELDQINYQLDCSLLNIGREGLEETKTA